jgi:hypothetical protein
MTILDPASNIGKMRLRCGDFSDLPLMPDEVYMSALEDCNGNLPQACILVCRYILASLTGQTHQKLAQVEVYGREWFLNYKEFILLTISNPNFMAYVAMPYAPSLKDECGNDVLLPLDQFQRDWNALYGVTEARQNHVTATAIHPYF